jgi:hypothetical protein
MSEQYVKSVRMNPTVLIEILEPGGQTSLNKIECTISEAKAIHEQLGRFLEDYEQSKRTPALQDPGSQNKTQGEGVLPEERNAVENKAGSPLDSGHQ